MMKKIALFWLPIEMKIVKLGVHLFYRDPYSHEYMMLWVDNRYDMIRDYINTW